MSNQKTVAVTGASGFVGKYLLEELIQEGFDVIALCRKKPEIECKWNSIDYSLASLNDALKTVDIVIHLAGRRMTRDDNSNDLAPFLDANIVMIGNLVAACKKNKVKKIIYSSTIAVYSKENDAPYTEDLQPGPLNAYALSKLLAEQYLDMLTKNTELLVVSLRFAAIYGHGEKGTPALMKFVNLAVQGKTVTLTGNSNYCIDQLYIRDAISAIKCSIKKQEVRGVFNIGSGAISTVRDIAISVNNQFGNVGNLNDSSVVDTPITDSTMDISKAKEVLDWEPVYNLDSGLNDFNHVRLTQ